MKIRRRKYASGNVGWQLDLGVVAGQDGKKGRLQLAFESKKEAEVHREKLMKERNLHGSAALAMSQGDRVRYAAADAKLVDAGLSIEQAVEWALERGKAVVEKVMIVELVRRFVQSREENNCRDRYLRQLKVSLGGFSVMNPATLVVDVTREMVRKWMGGNGWEPTTQKGYLGDLRACFQWARDEGLMKHDPCTGITTPEVDEKEVEVFTPEQCERLLVTAVTYQGRKYDRKARKFVQAFIYLPLIGYGALATFVGIRPEEVQRTPRKKIHVDLATAVVTGKASKTRQRRTVSLPENCLAWLRLWMELCPDQEMIIPQNFRKLWEGLREAAGLKPPGWAPKLKLKVRPVVESKIPPWPKDVLRHTAATMHYAKYQNLALLQAQLGHHEDEDTLFEHYRAVEMQDGTPVTAAIAERFYAIFPPAIVLEGASI